MRMFSMIINVFIYKYVQSCSHFVANYIVVVFIVFGFKHID